MGWFKTKVRNWILTEDALETSLKSMRGRNSIAVDSDSIDSDRAIRFTAYKAAGGMVVETNFYDRIKDRSYRSLHIITDDKDLGYEIGKIITMETMKI
jgi:hypothetical protein